MGGIEIYRSSRIEALAELLAQHLVDAPPRSVLSAQTLIVGQPGMRHWLTGWLASRPPQARGRRPYPQLAANLDMRLPSEWLDALAVAHLGIPAIAVAAYRRPALRWRILELLPQLEVAAVQRYLQGDPHSADGDRRAFQLADRLANLYSQYLVYRRDWLIDWEAGGRQAPQHWQGPLWRRLVQMIGLPHRGQLLGGLLERLRRLPPDPEQPVLHVFGLSHLPPDVFAALDALAASRRICLYFPDPCRELWDHLGSQRRAALASDLDGGDWLQAIGHPLLASLGRLGQHFSLLLHQREAQWDLRDQADEAASGRLGDGASLLARVQHSIRSLDPDALRLPAGSAQDLRFDPSLRVHACHTRLRELEVLKDALLDRLAADPTLEPREIVVMAPNMSAYAPLLPCVFGPAGELRSALPYRLADVPLLRSHPLLAAVRGLLDLPGQRIGRSQLLALLALPAVARRFGLDDEGLAALERWLQRCHVAWGLDAAMKASFGAAEVDMHSFAFGLDRMFAGLLLGQAEESDPDPLFQDILPATPVSGPQAACLGALSALLDVLRDWRDSLGQPRPMAQWCAELRQGFARLFLEEGGDDDERAALKLLQGLLSRLEGEAAASASSAALAWTAVREALLQALDGVPERQPFLAGGITFCGMVPQRSIPFRVLALIGLDDGEFPRSPRDGGLDLMREQPRLGDRDNRMEDRYLFLEALMSAREALHLSYVGEGVRDGKPRNPAQPLAELLAFLERVLAPGGQPPWLLRHPLQPFDARYFDPRNADPASALRHAGDDDFDPRLWSYSQEYAAARAHAAGAQAGAADWQFLGERPALPEPATDGRIELADLARFFRDPARQLCRESLALSRAALEASASEDEEPLEIGAPPFDGLVFELVQNALLRGESAIDARAPPRFTHSGRYASGEPGRRTWLTLHAQARTWLARARELLPFAAGAASAQSLAVEVEIAGRQLRGLVGGLYPVRTEDGETWWKVAFSRSGGGYALLLPHYLEWAALHLAYPERSFQIALLYGKDTPECGPEPAFSSCRQRLKDDLQALLGLYLDAAGSAGAWFPRTSHAWAKGPADGARLRARKAWLGTQEGSGERDYAPGYNRLLGGEGSFLDPGNAAHSRFVQIAERLQTMLAGDGARATADDPEARPDDAAGSEP